jgi:predicted histidine transporter YuiF (NhaC family)
MRYYDYFVYYIFFIKIVFFITSTSLVILKRKQTKEVEKQEKQNKQDGNKTDQNKDTKTTNMSDWIIILQFWKERSEFLFIALMSILLVFLFSPWQKKLSSYLNIETKTLLYIYGFIILIQAKWGIFFKEAPWFREIKQIVGR